MSNMVSANNRKKQNTWEYETMPHVSKCEFEKSANTFLTQTTWNAFKTEFQTSTKAHSSELNI